MEMDKTQVTDPINTPVNSDAMDGPCAAMDSEATALMAGWLLPTLDRAASWPALTETLAAKGYALAFRGGRLCLTDHSDGTPICTLRSLGSSLRHLVVRLGRPVVRPLPGMTAAGELCHRSGIERHA